MEPWNFVLDIDHTLIHAVRIWPNSTHVLRSLHNIYNKKHKIFFVIIGDTETLVGPNWKQCQLEHYECYKIYVRPHAIRLINTIVKLGFLCHLWTAGHPEYAKKVVFRLQQLLKHKNSIQNIWTRNDCKPLVIGEHITYRKPLKTKFNNLDRVIMLDDLPWSSLDNMENWLPIKAYWGPNERNAQDKQDEQDEQNPQWSKKGGEDEKVKKEQMQQMQQGEKGEKWGRARKNDDRFLKGVIGLVIYIYKNPEYPRKHICPDSKQQLDMKYFIVHALKSHLSFIKLVEAPPSVTNVFQNHITSVRDHGRHVLLGT